MGLPHSTDPSGADYAVVGLPLDGSTLYRTGARFGPSAIRDMSVMLRGFHRSHGVDTGVLRGLDYGDCPVVPAYVEASYDAIEKHLEPLVASDAVPIGLGGDHSVSLCELRVLARRHGPLGLVQLDAHSDVRDLTLGQRYGAGTPFRRAVEEGLLDLGRIVQLGLRGGVVQASDLTAASDLGFTVVTLEEARASSPTGLLDSIRGAIGSGPAFLTIDLDIVDPAFAPGVSSPVVGGLTSSEVVELVRGLTDISFVGCDVVELIPAYDPVGITALLAATLAWECIALLALRASRQQAACKETLL